MSHNNRQGFENYSLNRYGSSTIHVDPVWAAEMVSLPQTESGKEDEAINASPDQTEKVSQSQAFAIGDQALSSIAFHIPTEVPKKRDPLLDSLLPESFTEIDRHNVKMRATAKFMREHEDNPFAPVTPERHITHLRRRVAEKLTHTADVLASATQRKIGSTGLQWFAFDKIPAAKKPAARHRGEKQYIRIPSLKKSLVKR